MRPVPTCTNPFSPFPRPSPTRKVQVSGSGMKLKTICKTSTAPLLLLLRAALVTSAALILLLGAALLTSTARADSLTLSIAGVKGMCSYVGTALEPATALTSAPEPATYAILGSGLILLGCSRRRTRRS